jgi:hypothetical protein
MAQNKLAFTVFHVEIPMFLSNTRFHFWCSFPTKKRMCKQVVQKSSIGNMFTNGVVG